MEMVVPRIIQAIEVQTKMKTMAAMRRITANPPEGGLGRNGAGVGPVQKRG
jgi:hypothetical protein